MQSNFEHKQDEVPNWGWPHGWTILAVLLTSISLFTNQVHGNLECYLEPTYRWEMHFGWPLPFMRCPFVMGSGMNAEEFVLAEPRENWLFLTPDARSVNWLPMFVNVVVCAIVVAGVFMAVERYCVTHKLRTRYSTVGVLAIMASLATFFAMRHPGISMESAYTALLKQLLYLIVGLAWFGWLQLLSLQLSAWFARRKARST